MAHVQYLKLELYTIVFTVSPLEMLHYCLPVRYGENITNRWAAGVAATECMTRPASVHPLDRDTSASARAIFCPYDN